MSACGKVLHRSGAGFSEHWLDIWLSFDDFFAYAHFTAGKYITLFRKKWKFI